MTHSTIEKAKLKEGDECRLRGNDFMWCRVIRLLPKGLVECECSSSRDFSFGLIKTFKARDLRPLIDGRNDGTR